MSWIAPVVVAAVLATAPVEVPSLLRATLSKHPSLAIVEPARHFPGDYTVDVLREWGMWPPWRVVDLDRDGVADVVSAVARRSGDRVQFGVMAVHASEPHRVWWVNEPQDRVIYGVAPGPAQDTVVPLYCIECDANAWYRWSAGGYEVELFAPGEEIAVATYESGELGLFRNSERSSGLFVTVPPCTRAKVLRVRGAAYDGRWYFVELLKPGTRGWIPATFAAESECIG